MTTISGFPRASHSQQERAELEEQDGAWRSLFKIGAAAAILSLAVVLFDIVLTYMPGPTTPEPGRGTAIDWFKSLQENWFMGTRGLGLLNVINSVLAFPLFLALYGAHRRVNVPYAALAAIVLFAGATLYIANNAALPMLALSGQYAAATSEAERALLAAAGQSLLARSEDFTPGSLMGFLFTEAGQLTMAFVMLRSGVFSRLTAWAGIVGFGLLLAFTLWVTFTPAYYQVAVGFAAVGGLSSMLWNMLVARRLLQLGGNVSN